MRVEQCKGFRDLSPQEMGRFRFIARAFRECCFGWGFSEVRTPTLEYLHLFTATGTLTPGMLGRVYSFLDWDGWSGQRVVLRPDGTIPVARFYIDNLAGKGLAKLFYLANIFRFEETGKEARERWQGGVELIGVSSPLADVELMVMALEVLTKVGVKGVGLRLSHAGIIRSLLSRLRLSPREQAQVFDQILDGDSEALAEIKSQRPRLGRALAALIELKGDSSAALKEVRALFDHGLPEITPHMDNMISIAELLEAAGVRYRIDIASGRGFEYYTGVIFELYKDERKLGGGGRYDALIPLMGGGEVPASGFALYLDPLLELVAPETALRPRARRVLIQVESKVIGSGFEIARRLREAGNVAEFQLGGQEPADFGWLLELKDEAPFFILTDRTRKQRFEPKDADGVLALVGGRDVA
ncbi:MAG: ATP phosphoribosyltransferase regulatory subunit [Dehalococcoidales bacterium]|nr:ATP phosphoribosyltransferase regulatory subunit [Dehalococcoidales bacterium]